MDRDTRQRWHVCYKIAYTIGGDICVSKHDVVKLFASSLFSLVFVFILALATGNVFTLARHSCIAAVYIGLFEMGFTFVLWLKALRLSESTGRISNLVYLTPFISLVFIHFILGERVYYTSVIGLCLIVSGIVLQRVKKI